MMDILVRLVVSAVICMGGYCLTRTRLADRPQVSAWHVMGHYFVVLGTLAVIWSL